MAQIIELNKLLDSVGRDIAPSIRSIRFGTDLFSDTTGFHIYAELWLKLKLAAAEDIRDAQRMLQILQEYTLIAEACAAESSATLLEVQGERIHLLFPAPSPDKAACTELLRFCQAFTHAVYTRIGNSAGKEFNGFKMAADHGRAILVASGVTPNGSIVSLGPAANAPAKELKRNGTAGTLRMRASHYATVEPRIPTRPEWVDVPMLTQTGEAPSDLAGRFLSRIENYVSESQETPGMSFAGSSFLESFQGGTVSQPLKIQGFPLRADLDGFSKQVQTAFTSGPDAVALLVQRFFNIMKYPGQFRSRIGKTIDLPWAGDCANIIVLPNGTGYADAREFLPVKAASEWHTQRREAQIDKRQWADDIGEATWAVGVAGGDDDEGSNGYVLVAPLKGRNRDFMVATGWGVGRSLDAQESEGVKGDDTVIHKADYSALDSLHQNGFRQLNSIFMVHHGLTRGTLRRTSVDTLAPKSPIIVPAASRPIPAPRPWYGKP